MRQLYRQYNIEVNHAILFYVEDHEEPVIFVGKDKIIVGREDAMGRITPEFETTRFNGSANGISRMHAKIVREGDQYLIQDLGSTNGTRLNGNKLVPYQYVPLHDGAILQFGRLMVSAFIINRDED
ncbi:MAG: FHA domain-containing protein [Chloroflexota bacterium]